MHFDYTNEDARQWLRNSAGLEELVADALLTGETRPRATVIGDGVLVALRGINMNPGSDSEKVGQGRIASTMPS
jgi:zinc transporter